MLSHFFEFKRNRCFITKSRMSVFLPLTGAFESTFEICSIYANIHEQALKKNINLSHKDDANKT